MLNVIWSGANAASDILLLLALLVAGLLAIIEGLREPVAALLPASIALAAAGLLAL